jgi:hypothetical protein
VSRQIQPHDVEVEWTTHWLELKAWARKGADNNAMIGGIDLARKAENPIDLGRAIP